MPEESDSPFMYDIGIVGLGRVGLPLGLSLAAGMRVIGFDINKNIVHTVNQKKMPFHEKGYDELIKQIPFEATEQISRISEAENLIITVGTPLRHPIEADLSQIDNVVEQISKYLKKNQNVILRSTVAPQTTTFVKRKLESLTGFTVGENLFLSFCPERIAEGKAMEELSKLPQIIGAEDERSFQKASNVFSFLTPDILRTNYVSAELVKLFNNISRYIHFAVSNQFAIVAEQFGARIHEILDMANYKYPRGIAAKPGFTAGTCLRKDFGMINETIPYSDLLLNAWKVNEFMPKFLVDGLKRRTDIGNKQVAVLGYTFKQETDDPRDSLVPKLYRYLQREVPASVLIHEPYLPGKVTDSFNTFQFDNAKLQEAVSEADIVIVAVNHQPFQSNFPQILSQMNKDEAWVADLWNLSGTGKIFFQKKEYEGMGSK